MTIPWSCTVGQLKEALKDVPDDYEVMLENAEVSDIDISAVHVRNLLPPSPTGKPGLLILGGGQIVNFEYDYDARLDAHLEMGGGQWWNDGFRTDIPYGWNTSTSPAPAEEPETGDES